MKLIRNVFMVLCTIIVIFISSCEEFLDVNQPPGSPGTDGITESAVLPFELAGWRFNYRQQSTYFAYWTLQYVNDASSVSGKAALDITNRDTNPLWRHAIVYGIKNAIDIRDIAKRRGNKNYQGIGEALMAVNFATITDYFGDIPFTEAFKFPEITQPKYDPQPFVYDGIFQLLDSAIIHLSDNSVQDKPSKDDLVNQGDISKWLKFAYGLKARYAMRLSYAPGKTKYGQAQIAIEALSNSMTSNADNIDFENFDATGSRGWVYQDQLSKPFSYTPSIFLIDLLKNLNDPRLQKMFDPAYDGSYYGWKSGTKSPTNEYPSRLSRTKYLSGDMPSMLMSYSECKFLEAEAQLFAGNLLLSQIAFEKGIEADCQRLGIDQSSIDAYISSLILPDNEEAAQEMIITQKYLANYLGTSECLFDHLRTGYPKFDYPANIKNVVLTCPRRLPYSFIEVESNKNTPEYVGTPQSPHNRVWWDTKVQIE